MSYTLGEAAKATGKTKPTILRAIQAHKISAQKNDHGEWQIDPAELHRLYQPISEEPTETERSNNALQVEVRLLREMLQDIREDRDRWRTQAEKLVLTDQRAMVTPPPARQHDHPQAPATGRKWWHWGRRESV
jgi:hypothetical protein